MKQNTSWFDVDKAGLAKLLERKDMAFVVYEMLQNAWDEDSKEVSLFIETVPHKSLIALHVIDDNPEGFQDISHAYTLFAHSYKKDDPTKRGRFNLGEKLALAMAQSAVIRTTSGSVTFDKNGQRRQSKQRTIKGSHITLILPCARNKIHQFTDLVPVIAPRHIKTTLFGKEIKPITPRESFKVPMPTEISGKDGTLKKTVRQTWVDIHNFPAHNGKHYIYEMGIPVVCWDVPFHVDVQQKIPLNMDRDNVTPAYAKALKAHTLNAVSHLLEGDAAADTWVNEAIESNVCDLDAVKTVIQTRHGDQVAVIDPTDPESKNRATAQGYEVLGGRSYSKKAWERIRETGSVPPTSTVAPTPKPFHPGGTPLVCIPEHEYDEKMLYAKHFAIAFANHCICRPLIVKFTNDRNWPFEAVYGKGATVEDRALTINLHNVELKERPDINFISLLIHEFAHEYESNHLMDAYHKACCDLGARWGILKETIYREADEKAYPKDLTPMRPIIPCACTSCVHSNVYRMRYHNKRCKHKKWDKPKALESDYDKGIPEWCPLKAEYKEGLIEGETV